MIKNKKNKLTISAFSKTQSLETLINKLNTTTIGDLQVQINSLKNTIVILQSEINSLKKHNHTYEIEAIKYNTSEPIMQ